jgi:ADP-ribose pyrophosphatase YjhB (NUDIX family)
VSGHGNMVTKRDCEAWAESLWLDSSVVCWPAVQGQTSGPRVCVAAVVTDSPGHHIALVRTKRGWELPGGRAELGEMWQEATRRELREELGTEVRLLDEHPEVLNGMPVAGAGYQSVILVSRGVADGDLRPADGDACLEARWFARNEVPLDELSAIATAEIVKQWTAANESAHTEDRERGRAFVLHGETERGNAKAILWRMGVVGGRAPSADEIQGAAGAYHEIALELTGLAAAKRTEGK